MKLTNKQIRQIVKEELNKVLNENISEEKMLKLAKILLSGEQGFRHVVLLGQDLGFVKDYVEYDRSKSDAWGSYERYEHGFIASPEFMKAIASALGEEIRGYKVLPTGEEVLDGYDYSDPQGGSDQHRFEHKVNEGGTNCRYFFSIYPTYPKPNAPFKDAMMHVHMNSEKQTS
jgi:hypothetical protein